MPCLLPPRNTSELQLRYRTIISDWLNRTPISKDVKKRPFQDR